MRRVNLRALHLLKEERPEEVPARCAELGLDPAVADGVMILLIANDGNLASLSAKQMRHYDEAIEPLFD